MSFFMYLFIGAFIVAAVMGIVRWMKNNKAPVLTADARVVAKRTRERREDGDITPTITHYATFEVESGNTMEFGVSSWEYGRLVEGAAGRLTFQGTRYKGFISDR